VSQAVRADTFLFLKGLPMEMLVVWVTLAVTAVVQGLALWCLLHYFARAGQRDCGLMSASVLAVSLAVSLVLLLPADVSVVSNLGDIVADDDLELEGKLRA
jgi:hypothetical protein